MMFLVGLCRNRFELHKSGAILVHSSKPVGFLFVLYVRVRLGNNGLPLDVQIFSQ